MQMALATYFAVLSSRLYEGRAATLGCYANISEGVDSHRRISIRE